MAERRIFNAADAVGDQSAYDAGEMAYQARTLVQTTLPHTNPGDATEHTRRDGYTTLTVMSPSHIGLPYGALPRIVLLWVATQAVQGNTPVIDLGGSVIDWFRALGYRGFSGGYRDKAGRYIKSGNGPRIHDQLVRLQHCTFLATRNEPDQVHTLHVAPIHEAHLWWSDSSRGRWRIVLDRDYYDELREHAVPLDWRVVRGLRQSPMALDLYSWMSYRFFALRRDTRIPWDSLRAQIGAAHRDVRGFRDHARRVLRRDISAICQDYRYDDSDPRYLVLRPSRPVVERRPSRTPEGG